MRRLLIIGATVVALSATATIALAGTEPVSDIETGATVQMHGQDIDPLIANIMERLRSARHWHSDHVADRVSDRAHDAVRDGVHDRSADVARHTEQVRDHSMDIVHDTDQVMDQTMEMIHDDDQVMDQVQDADGTVDDQDMGAMGNMGSTDSMGSMGNMGSTDSMGSMGNMGSTGSMGGRGGSDH